MTGADSEAGTSTEVSLADAAALATLILLSLLSGSRERGWGDHCRWTLVVYLPILAAVKIVGDA